MGADRNRFIKLSIEPLEPTAVPAPPSDASIAAGIRRVARFVRSRTLEMGIGSASGPERPAFVGVVPNQFPKPVPPGDFKLSFFDAYYSLARYALEPDEALVITGRWPPCRAAYLCVWNRWQQTLDYANRPVGLNRARTVLEPDGSFRMVVAHADPGVPNWIDTEGRLTGTLFWRFVLPESDVDTPQAEVVPFASVAASAPTN